MSMQKITKKLPQLPQLAPRGNRGAARSAPTAPPPYRGGAVGHKMGGATCKKLQVVKNNKPGGKTHLTDHEVELMRIMHEEFPLGHAGHLGYHKLSAIFGTSLPHTRNICLYRKRVGSL